MPTKNLKTWLRQHLFQEQITVAVYDSCLTSSACVQSLDWRVELESYLHNRSRWIANLARLTARKQRLALFPAATSKGRKPASRKRMWNITVLPLLNIWSLEDTTIMKLWPLSQMTADFSKQQQERYISHSYLTDNNSCLKLSLF